MYYLKAFLRGAFVLVLGFVLSACGTQNQAHIHDENIAVYFPRELFFTSALPEEYFLEFLQERGGIVAHMDEDTAAFWRAHPENAGTVNIRVVFAPLELTVLVLDIESDLQLYLEAVTASFHSISAVETEQSGAYTRFIVTADFEELGRGYGIIELLDFLFPFIGQLEYLRRIFSLYDMTVLQEITFFVKNDETGERVEVYNFFDDAPLGLSIRHGVNR